MTPEQLAALTDIVATIDRRLSGFEKRSINTEAHMAESATATDSKMDDIKTLLGNYVEATRARERQAKLTEEAAKGLISEIREKCPEAVG